MGRRSSMEKLPDDIRDQINGFLAQKAPSVDTFTAYLKGLLKPFDIDVSRSAAHRHMSRHAQIAKRMRESRELARTFARELNAECLDEDQGLFLIQALQTLINQTMMARLSSEGADETATRDLLMLARAQGCRGL